MARKHLWSSLIESHGQMSCLLDVHWGRWPRKWRPRDQPDCSHPGWPHAGCGPCQEQSFVRANLHASLSSRSARLNQTKFARHLIVAGTHSGVGKTTVALALMAAFRVRGSVVQPFKVGPDFIDPGHHTDVCGRISRNLDTWMLADDTVRDTFHRATASADLSIIEGVMGLFDGRSVEDPRGSTGHLATVLNVPVLLVVDAEAVAGSIAAVVKGFAEFDPAVRVVGVLCNRVAGLRHYAYLESAIRKYTHVIPVGWLPNRPEWEIPERHLGLVTRDDLGDSPFSMDLDQVAKLLAETVDLERVYEMATCSRGDLHPPCQAREQADLPTNARRVAVAKDAAFCFYYQDNLDLLRNAGGQLIPFSPLQDAAVPEGADLLYLGGGYPESHARQPSLEPVDGREHTSFSQGWRSNLR